MKQPTNQRQNWETPWFRWPLVWTLTLGVALLIGFLNQLGFLAPMEASSCDWRMRLRGKQPIKTPIVIIEIDQASLRAKKLAEPMMLWGNHHADVFEILQKLGAKAIGFDLIQQVELGNFVNPNPDQREAQVIAATPQLVLSFSRYRLPDGTSSDTLPNNQFNTALALGGGRIGYDKTTPDPDGVIRRFLPSSDGDLSFPLAIAATASGQEPLFQRNTVELGTRRIPLSPNGEIIIDYVGPDRTFPHVSYLDLLANPNKFKDLIKNSICMIGVTSYAFQDYHPIPLLNDGIDKEPTLMAGIEVHANAVHTLLNGHDIKQSRLATTWVLIALASLLAVPLSWLPRSTTQVLPCTFLILFFWLAICQWVFLKSYIQLPLVAVSVALLTNVLLSTSARLWQEGRQKRWLEEAMGRKVSPLVLDYLRKTPGALDLGGHRQEVTILFSDIRGFTQLSEQLDPEQVTRFLNNYLQKMVKIVFDNGGTVDKFIGDGIMVIFNWPLAQPDHARRALLCAVQMQETVAASQAEWEAMGMPPIHIGIGVHSGTAILGNIGSSQYMEQTAIGDTVNVASRAEGLCKTVGKSFDSGILLSENTFTEAKAMQLSDEYRNFEVIPAGDTPVRGRRETLQLFAVKMKDFAAEKVRNEFEN